MQLRTMIATAAAALALSACTIADVTVAPGDDRLVVEGVLRSDSRGQFILLHRGVQSGVAAGEEGAEVVVTREDGASIRFQQTDDGCYAVDPAYLQVEDPVEIRGTCYASPDSLQYWVAPGGTYDLTVRTLRGEEARGRTTVPGRFTVAGMELSRVGGVVGPCTLSPFAPLRLTWTQAPGAWGYIAPLRVSGLQRVLPDSFNAPDPLVLVGVSVSAADTSLVLPAQFGVFDRFSYNQHLLRLLQAGLPAGTTARVVVAAADRNYINGVRGGSFNPSGPIRISSIVGDAVGVFGSLQPLTMEIAVGPRREGTAACGEYMPRTAAVR